MLDPAEINKRKTLNHENMVFIDGGSFIMGSDKFYPEEKPIHKVTVDSFWMDKHPVTNKAFSEFVSATNYLTIAERPLNRADFSQCPRREPSSRIDGF
ncbi:MAG TPA: SUMF1/EgtB/PvdO family nonheme iron enzyme [Nitrososphaeraceae archaeon]|jgi:formylglycine-generating enzyme required for sulfatase activity|nr:SUMF1/EgtB/PvdO family nonheme iron enzyme [Nitrososphaeraceae archaeon]